MTYIVELPLIYLVKALIEQLIEQPVIVTFALIFALIAVLMVLSASIRVVREYERGILFRLGRLVGPKGPGLFLIIPKVDAMLSVDLRTITYDARAIRVITKDNIRCDVDSFVYYRVTDPVKAVVEVENYVIATQTLAKTVLRDVIGHFELDELLSKTSEITKAIAEELDEYTDPWGIKVNAVAVSDVILPGEMQRAIAKQAEAERERRSRIIVAEGEYMAAQKMSDAAQIYAVNPIALRLRELQNLSEIAREKNLIVVTTTTELKGLGDMTAIAGALRKGEKKEGQRESTRE